MFYRVLDFATIFLSLAVIYGLPPLLFIRTACRRLDWTESLLLTFGAGLSGQAVMGLFWNHFYARHAGLEVCSYLGLWLVLTMVVAGTRIFVPGRAGFMPAMRIAGIKPALPGETPSSLSDYLLPAILLTGVALRGIDALMHPALGQSDAYSHLQFLRQIMQWGQLINPMYPPGYSWTLALPTLIFHRYPYMMAR